MRENPLHFDECFTPAMKADSDFREYMSLVSSGTETPTARTPEKHHIVPREWLTWRVDGFDFDTEDPRNIVYLSVRGRILALQRLVLLFLSNGDSVTYRRLTETVARKYHLGRYEFWKNPYLDSGLVGFLAAKRAQELRRRKPKYSDEYLAMCRDILRSCDDEAAAFRRVKEELGFPSSLRALTEQLAKRFGGRR